MNLLSGVLGVIAVFGGRMDVAFYLMIAASVFDFCDGLSARALNAYSELGKQLDSLSDLISFGLLPALMLHRTMLSFSVDGVWCYIPLVIAVFSAFRLAKFNIDSRQTENFIGLAVPACAMVCGSLAYYVAMVPDSVITAWSSSRAFIPVVSVVLSLLLVSEIPMFSMKFKKGQNNKTPVHRMRVAFMGTVFACSLVTLLLALNWSFAVLLTFIAYIIMNIVNFLLTGKRR